MLLIRAEIELKPPVLKPMILRSLEGLIGIVSNVGLGAVFNPLDFQLCHYYVAANGTVLFKGVVN